MQLNETMMISKLYVVKKELTTVETSCNRVEITHRNFQLMELMVLTIVFFTLEQAVEDLFEDMGAALEFSKAVTI